jgi:hypothetical protein
MTEAPQGLRADILAWIDARLAISSARTSVSTLALLALKGEVEEHVIKEAEFSGEVGWICHGCEEVNWQDPDPCHRLRAIAKTLGIGGEGR